LQVGNIPINRGSLPEVPSDQEISHGYDVCGPHMEFRPNSGPERGESHCMHSLLLHLEDGIGCIPEKYVAAVSSGFNHNLLTPEELQKHGIHQSRGPLHPSYNTYEARLRSYESWPRSLKQKPDKLSEAGFYYTGKLQGPCNKAINFLLSVNLVHIMSSLSKRELRDLCM
jgi:hypothetical protein